MNARRKDLGQITIIDAIRQARISSLGSSAVVSDAIAGIERLIASGRFVPGERLVEADLVRELQVSRGPIREALRILAGDGVVELTPNKGARIRSLSGAQLVEMVQVIVGLFSIGAEMLTAQARPAKLTEALRAQASQIRQAAERKDKHALAVRLTEYHQIVAHFSRNAYLATLLQRIHLPHYVRSLEQALDQSILEHIAQSYDEITTALIHRDGARVKQIMAEQLSHVVAQLGGRQTSGSLEQALDPLVRGAAQKEPGPSSRANPTRG